MMYFSVNLSFYSAKQKGGLKSYYLCSEQIVDACVWEEKSDLDSNSDLLWL